METEKPEQTVEPRDKKPELRVVDRRWWARGEAGESPEPLERKPTYIEDLERRLGEITTALQNAQLERRRALEEFEQAKIRIRRDVSREVERGRRTVLADLLEVLDNLDRAIDAARSANLAAGSPVLRGVELVRDQFRTKLEGFGVAHIPASGQPFDASRHEAVTMAPVTDPSQDGVVVAVIKEGYSIGEDVLRPASVVVGKLEPPR